MFATRSRVRCVADTSRDALAALRVRIVRIEATIVSTEQKYGQVGSHGAVEKQSRRIQL